jgi:nucleoside-diphosphate-sugar epimerase
VYENALVEKYACADGLVHILGTLVSDLAKDSCQPVSCLDLAESMVCRYNPIKTTKTSFLGTMNMLGLAKRTNAKLLLASTSEVYGDPLVHPQPESYWGNVNPIGERSCYDEGMLALLST